MSPKYLFPGLLILAMIGMPFMATSQSKAHPQTTPQGTAHAKDKQTAATTRDTAHQEEGERVFQQNCSRCHTAPDGFSSRISGTVVRHMRVRASLSQHDEQELLRFLNP
jgi:cytochrome c2